MPSPGIKKLHKMKKVLEKCVPLTQIIEDMPKQSWVILETLYVLENRWQTEFEQKFVAALV